MMVLMDNVRTIYPADRCTWQQVNNTATTTNAASISINGPRFYDGQTAGGTVIAGEVQLGFIGKSGRFVRISD